MFLVLIFVLAIVLFYAIKRKLPICYRKKKFKTYVYKSKVSISAVPENGLICLKSMKKRITVPTRLNLHDNDFEPHSLSFSIKISQLSSDKKQFITPKVVEIRSLEYNSIHSVHHND